MTVSFAPSAAERVVSPVDLCGLGTWLYDDGSTITFGVYYCGRWDCPRCAAYKREQWIAAAIQAGPQLWVVVVDADGMEALRKRIERRGGEYFRVREEDAALVFSNVEVPGAEPLTDSTAIRKRMSASLHPTSRRRRISRSQGWAAFGQVPIDRERTDIESNENPTMRPG